MREKQIAVLQTETPEALPRDRADVVMPLATTGFSQLMQEPEVRHHPIN
jgi:hypothetical protein